MSTLFKHQEVGAVFMAISQQALLADVMGTGKGPTAIAALELLSQTDAYAYPAVIVCPNSMKATWAREFATWAPHRTVTVARGSAQKRRQALQPGDDVYIINWEAARLHSRLAPYGSVSLTDDEKTMKELNNLEHVSVIADEAHKAKSGRAKMTRALWAIGQAPTCRYRFALTGTPVANKMDDLWSILHFLQPREWASYTRYIDRYALQGWSAFGGLEVLGIRPDTREEFFSVVHPRLRRMEKERVLPFLPPKLEEVREVEMDPKQAKAYKDLADKMITMLDDGTLLMAPNPLTLATRLVQLASAYAAMEDVTQRPILSEPSCKLDALDDIYDELAGEPVVVAAMSRQLIMLASARLQAKNVPHSLIVGGQTEVEREQSIQDFQGGKTSICLMTMGAGGVGITLTRARVMVLLQRDWSYINTSQARDRVHRIGSEQHESILYIDIIVRDTIEERQLFALGEKKANLDEVVRADPSVLAYLIRGPG